MKQIYTKFQPFLPVFPLLFSLYVAIHSLYIFMVYAVPIYVGDLNYHVNPFMELQRYHFYPLYFVLSVLVLIMLIITIIILGAKKPNQHYYLLIALSALFSVYFANLNGSFAGYWYPQAINDLEYHLSQKSYLKIRDKLIRCDTILKLTPTPKY